MISRIRKATLSVVPFLLVLLAPSCAGQKLARDTLSVVRADGEAVSVSCEIARTEAEHENGYMGRKSIPDGTGMLFAFKADQQMLFWMKNTPHPLSIAYIDSSGVIREIYDMKPFSLDTVASERSLRYALEVPQGWFSRAGIAVGDRLSSESLRIVSTPSNQ